MQTDSLRLFVLAAETRNISAAGRVLGMPPAVASAKLAKLERTVGADLLHRTTRKVSLSLEGQEFLPFAREILAQEDAARAALGQGGVTPSGLLRFATSSTFAQRHLVPILPEFLALYPHIDLDLRLSDTRFDLIEGSFDLALRSAPHEDSSHKGRKLADDVRVLCASPSYLLAHGTPMTPEDLAGHQLLAFQSRVAVPLQGPDGQSGLFDPRRSNCRLIIDDGLSHKRATMAGAGISINSLWSIHDALASGALMRVLPDYVVDDQSALWLVYPKANVLSPKVRVFIDFLVERLGKGQIFQ